MPPGFCSSCELQAAELRMELCSQCRWKRQHKCMVKGCKTPASKVNLKKIPGRLTQATEAVRRKILSQFGMTSDVSQCCKACFIKLHRATTEFANAQQEVICNKGRPSVPYEHASTKTKTRIEKKAMELFHDNINTLKESYNQISGGCGSTLLDITLKAANIPTVAKITESKADTNIIQGLSLAYASTSSLKERVQILSSVAPHLDNKTLKENFSHLKDGQEVSCSSHEITKARLHYNQHGAAATAFEEKETATMRTSPEQLAFLVQFLHSPECTERSSYKTADCKGKRSTWLSDILGGGTQPVLHQGNVKNAVKKFCALETFRGTKSPRPALSKVSHQVWHINQPVLLIETNGRSRLAQVLCIAPITFGVVPGSTVPVSN